LKEMGADASVELSKPFGDIAKCENTNILQDLIINFCLFVGPRARVESAFRNYLEGEYDFGIDIAAIKSITGYDSDEAKELLSALSKNDAGM
jgi:hypothetical protein